MSSDTEAPQAAVTTIDPPEEVEPAPVPVRGPRSGRREPGPRQTRLARIRRRRRRRRFAAVVVVLALAGLAGVAATEFVTSPPPTDESPAVSEPRVPAAEQQAFLLVRADDEGGPAEGVTLFAGRSADGPALVLFVPVGTLVEVPGLGLDRLAQAQQYGGIALVQASVENALGIRIDHTAHVSDAGLGAWLARTDGLEVDVPGRLLTREADGEAQVRFEPGPQILDGERLAELWAFAGPDEDELSTFPRQQRVLHALLDWVAEEGDADALADGGPPQFDSTASEEWFAELFSELATAREEGRLDIDLLPVEPFGGSGPDGAASYRLRESATEELVASRLADRASERTGDDATRIQVLNGVGQPGVGRLVDELLAGDAFRLVLTDNARNFDFEETQILIYEEDEDSRAAAERVRERLGVGTIRVSRQPQTVVDLTIVVGADLLAEHDPSG